ncbi:MAG TPA: hypothetical protein VFB38_01420 [Chthonomonadaceae bacterium]|nr:hypothetical protein [Chthonomonadaceae bacterium]
MQARRELDSGPVVDIAPVPPGGTARQAAGIPQIALLMLCSALMLTLAGSYPARAELQILKVAADRIYYEPGVTARLEATIANPDTESASATLRVELISDLDTRVRLVEQPITVQGKGQFEWSGSAKLQPVLGMELTATLLRDGKVVAAASDVFNCARSVHQVLILGSGSHGGWQFSGTMDKIRSTYPAEFAGQIRSTYGNWLEKFAWAPSDFDDLTPAADRWWAGQTAYNECATNMRAMIQAFHAQGIKVATYGKAAAGGPVGYEKLRRNPDLAGYTNGRFWGNYDAAGLDYLQALDPPKPGESRMVPGTPVEMEAAGYAGAGRFQPFTDGYNWCDVWYSCTDPRVADVGIGELAGSAKAFGFDGVRFDGEFGALRNQRLDGSWNAPEKFDSEAANVALVRRMKQACWAAKPGYLFGYNAGTDITWSIGKGNVPASFQEKCRDDGLIANEADAFPGDVPWIDYCLRVRREAEIVRHYGGHYATYGFNRGGDNLYNFIFEYGLRAHVMNAYTGPGGGSEWVNRSATRFSRLLWDDSLSTWRGAERTVSVTGSRPLLWKEFAAVGRAPEGGTRYILHLYNTPEAQTTLGKNQMPAATAENVTVAWKPTARIRRAWLVDMEHTSAAPIALEGGVFRVGNIPYWKILVVDTEGEPPAPTFEEPRTQPKPTGPSAADLQLTAPTGQSQPAWREVQHPAEWGGGESTADREPDPDATGGTACVGKPGRPPGSMAYTYQYPRIPGRYRATFRLKVDDNTVAKPVFRLSCGRSVESPFPGVGGLYSEEKTLKATDFARPNVYQDFAIEFDYADYGFMGVSAEYLGNAKGWWDCTTLELVRPWTDRQLADHYAQFQRPAGLSRSPAGPPRILAVRGLYNRLYRIDEAAALLPGAKLTDAYTSYHPQQGTNLRGYKWSWEDLWKQDLIVLANVEAKGLNYGQILMLSEWVKDGGGLVILGGNVTLGQDDNMKRAWPLFLPVTLSGPWEIRKCEPPVRIAGARGQSPEVVLYRHMVAPKPGATVLMKGVGGEPLLVGAAYGKGRVAVFTGTVLGEAPAGARAFWSTPDWVKSLASAMRWVCGEGVTP